MDLTPLEVRWPQHRPRQLLQLLATAQRRASARRGECGGKEVRDGLVKEPGGRGKEEAREVEGSGVTLW
eukprot:2769182-Rhodomonas_salina.1